MIVHSPLICCVLQPGCGELTEIAFYQFNEDGICPGFVYLFGIICGAAQKDAGCKIFGQIRIERYAEGVAPAEERAALSVTFRADPECIAAVGIFASDTPRFACMYALIVPPPDVPMMPSLEQ